MDDFHGINLTGRGLRGVKGDVGDVNPQMPIILAEARAARDEAEQAALDAAASAATAESAAGPTYADTTAGLAATADGEAFAVDNGDGTVTVWLNDGGVAVEQRTLATTDYLASPVGASAIGVASGRTLGDELKSFRTPEALGGNPGTVDGVNQNTMMGGIGTFSDSPNPVRPPWDAMDPVGPTVGGNSLGLSGHQITNNANSATILGGRAGYYSAVGFPGSSPTVNGYGSLTLTYGGDNWNNHLAGFCLSMHSDLIQGTGADGIAQKGSHGFVLGGSYHQIAGDYSGSIGGQMKQIYALQSISLAGRNHKMGTLANVDAVRRSAIVAGISLSMDNAEESAMLGGKNNTLTGNQSLALGGYDNTVAALRGATFVGRDCEVTAEGAVAMGYRAKADVYQALTRSSGGFAERGDSQTHHVEARRESVGPNVVLAVTGGGGTDLYTPEPNTTGIATFEIAIQEADVGTSNMAAYVLSFAYSNVGGVLTIKGQNLITVFEEDVAFNCLGITAGTGTRISIQVVVPNTNVYRATATGRIVVNRI